MGVFRMTAEEKKAYYEKNKALLDADMYDKLRACAKKSSFGNDYEFDDIFHKAVIKFLENYKAEKNAWKTFFTMIFVNTAKDIERQRKRMVYKPPVSDEEEEENDAGFEGDPSDEMPAIRALIETCAVLRDGMIARMKLGKKKKETGYFRCFFTEDITNGILHSQHLRVHISGEQRKYHAAVDMCFANHYAAKKCETITETVHAGLKPLSAFKEDDKLTGELCGYPLQNVVYTSYFQVSDANISSNKNKYRKWVSLIDKKAI